MQGYNQVNLGGYDPNRFKRKLLVAGLSPKCDEDKVIELFSVYGTCKVTFMKFNKTCATVLYFKAIDARNAAQDLNGFS